MTTLRSASLFLLSLSAAACGPQQSSDFGSTAALKAPKSSTTPSTSTHGLAGDYTVTSSTACGGVFNVDDPSTIVANATTVTISQDGYTPDEQDVFFTATLGDIITRPDQFDISAGYTTVDRKISTYSNDDDTFVFNEYLYDMSLTDAEGLAAGPFQTVELDAVKTGVSYELSYNDGEKYHCSFVTSH